MAQQDDPLAHAEHTAREWLATIAEAMGTDDHDHAYRMLRTWLHVIRDRLTVTSTAHFAVQLPEFLRGVYFEGWVPSEVPIGYDAKGFVELFACEAGVNRAAAPEIARAITAGLSELFPPGQLDHAFAPLPVRLRRELLGEATVSSIERHRLDVLEKSVNTLTEAVKTLTQGLEDLLTASLAERSAARAAQEAHRRLRAEEKPALHG
ncbi:DUF2267 domain-containing protein [Amycolatopsis sp. NPDC059657]|uniref:DUF2267 domain-containing protein n=1 Tax=Amycolatopsis sp. NPDC059657 TaxID=3346899 RepID=UPI0036704A3E